jgi:hypothetical protein
VTFASGLSGVDRLIKKCIATNGEYTKEAQIKVIEEWSFILPILRSSCLDGTPRTFMTLILQHK